MKLFAALYRGYLAVLRSLGAAEERTPEARYKCNPAELATARLGELDADATSRGDAYRGLGIAVALAGAVAALAGVLPLMSALDKSAQYALSVTELTLMAAIVLLLVIARRGRRKEAWIRARVAAEYLRYEDLRGALARAQSHEPAALAALKTAIHDVISGAHDQKKYHADRLEQYERMEGAARRATYVGFGIAFVATAAQTLLDLSDFYARWLLFFTVFVPVLIAALHGVNSFIQLPQLIAQHMEMLSVLDQMEKRVATNLEPEELVGLGAELLKRLENCEAEWARTAHRIDPHPG